MKTLQGNCLFFGKYRNAYTKQTSGKDEINVIHDALMAVANAGFVATWTKKGVALEQRCCIYHAWRKFFIQQERMHWNWQQSNQIFFRKIVSEE